jgi:hypothetical protein
MLLETKAQVAKVSLSLLIGIVWLFLLGVVVLVLCGGLNINPFRETTTSLLISAFVGAIGIIAALVLVNVATSVSLIADAKVSELGVAPTAGRAKLWVALFVGLSLVLTGVVFAGTYLSKRKYIKVVRHQAEAVVNENAPLLSELSKALASGTPAEYKHAEEIREFIENQRAELPGVTIVYADKFENRIALRMLNRSRYWLDQDKNESYRPEYYRCNEHIDCDYLKSFFAGNGISTLEQYDFRGSEYSIYIPVVGKESRYVLLFSRRNSYGKIGS